MWKDCANADLILRMLYYRVKASYEDMPNVLNIMKLSIQYKLLIAMFCATIAVVGIMAVVIQWSFDRGFLEYLNLEEQKGITRLIRQLEVYYEEQQSWDAFIEQPMLVVKMHALTLPMGDKREQLLALVENEEIPKWIMNTAEENKDMPLNPLQRIVLLDEEQNIVFGRKWGTRLPSMHQIIYEDRSVGSFGIYPPVEISERHQLLFVEKQRLFILLVVIAAVFITIGISLPLAYHLTKPIRRLSEATKQLKSGDYSTRVKNNANDELGRLSKDINSLAETLEENEIQRKLWVSDIAHELRTPLTGLQGEIEALQDGIREPKTETYDRLHQSVTRLNRLVEDLYDLSRYDLGTFSILPEEIDFYELVANEVKAHRYEADRASVNLEMTPRGIPDTLSLHGDRQRLAQLVGNLLTNSIRYTYKGGLVRVEVTDSVDSVQLDVLDTVPGVPDEALSRLFNRLYRVDQSRSRGLGGSGLGLAICRQIVLAHNGTITAKHAPQGGLWIQTVLPKAQEES